jgi:hypothetical protein
MTLTLAGYALMAALAFALWAWSRLRPNFITPFGNLVNSLMKKRRMRIALVVVWWWLGWHFYSNVSLASVGL